MIMIIHVLYLDIGRTECFTHQHIIAADVTGVVMIIICTHIHIDIDTGETGGTLDEDAIQRVARAIITFRFTAHEDGLQ